ncbi:MAG: biotin/lipoyl-binding protein [Bacteroidales bacterium]|nr:biotin/lipoyl-binding protein [Bacteroidales bacterium]
MKKIRKILIANRGEIAVRIMRTAGKMGIKTVAIYAANDKQAFHVTQADEAYALGTGTLQNTYLNLRKIEAAIRQSAVDAVHPGYGFLSENPEFPLLCERNNALFIGPDAKAIRVMGDKIQSRITAHKAGVNISEGITGSPLEILARKNELIYPVLVKASAGGGGKGMRVVSGAENLNDILKTTAREAKNYFGNDTVFVEHYFENPRHIEVQILGDNHGNVIHLFERECSLQRRHQKVIEEAPSPSVNQKLRKDLTDSAVKIAKAINYCSAGTVEFLVDHQDRIYFLEMNTRIQVEHPVTEKITGIDIVEQQIKIAEGYELSISLKNLNVSGHAVQARLYAEDPLQNYKPSPGFLNSISFPDHVDIRIDHGLRKQDFIYPDYDPMIAKVIAHDTNRIQAIHKLAGYLKEITVTGTTTNQEFLSEILLSKDFINNKISTQYLEKNTRPIIDQLIRKKEHISPVFLITAFLVSEMDRCNENSKPETWNKLGFWRIRNNIAVSFNNKKYNVGIRKRAGKFHVQIEDSLSTACCIKKEHEDCVIEINNVEHKFKIVKQNISNAVLKYGGYYYNIQRHDVLSPSDFEDAYKDSGRSYEHVISPMHGRVVAIQVSNGDSVKTGDTLVVIESMKIENNILAESDVEVARVEVNEGDQVKDGQLLIRMKNIEEEKEKE